MPRSPAMVVTCILGCFVGQGCGGTLVRAGGDDLDFGFIGSSTRVWVRGPWSAIEPSNDVDPLIDQLCPAVTRLPRADWRDYGQEYCGIIYTLADGVYYASMPSPLGRAQIDVSSKRKSCYVPASVRDVRAGATIHADYHSHPWAYSPMSVEDLSDERQLYSIRIQFDTRCHVLKYVPFKQEESHPGELYERREGRWELIGLVLPQDKKAGRVTFKGG